ncbi:hypothetical protein [Peribacillus sp. SCS-37]|uniref:hypothetical protein n=1 Tax=Paraperibacillus esterisolvens TaxID=3115296 RepID=UPI0039061DE0
MSKLTLAEAIKLKSVLNKRIHELEDEMDRVAFVEIEKGSDLPKQTRSIVDVEEDLEEIRKDFRFLDKLVYRANIDHHITFQDEPLSIIEAIELAAQLRAKARKFKELGSQAEEEHPYGFGEMAAIVKIAMYKPEEYRLKGLEADRQANRLSNLINAKNYSIELDFESEKYF